LFRKTWELAVGAEPSASQEAWKRLEA
jgi:hypothetical protein